MSARYLQAVFAIAICFVLPVQADEGRPAPVRSITTIDTERASILLDQHWNPERQTLRRIQEEGRDRVRDLTRRCQSLAPGQERRELEQQIVQLKREYEKRFLDARTALNRDLGFEPDATTAWSGDGSPVCTDNAQQHYPKTAADDAGGAYVVWVDERGTDQIYIQRLTSGGAVYPGWPVNGFPVTPTPPDVQSDPSIASDGSGGALIAWDQRDPVYMDWDIYVQRITGIGTRATGWPAGGVDVGYAIENQLEPRVISDGTGGAIVAWWDYRNPGTNSIYAGRVSNTGTKLWTSGGEWVASDVTALIVPPPICSDGANGVYLAWEGAQGGSNTDVFVQRLDSAGQVPVGWPSGGENFVPTTRYQTQPDIIPDGSGGAVLAWADYRSASDYDIYAMRITAGSNRYPGWTSTGVPVSAQAGSDQLNPLLVSDGNGGALVTWSDQRHPVPYIFCSKVTGAGSVVWAPGNNGMRVCFETDTQQGHQVCSDGEGGLIAVWEDSRGSDLDIYAQHITADGQYAHSLDGIAICTATGLTWHASVAQVAPQGAIVVFEDNRTSGTTGIDIYAQYIHGLVNLTPNASQPGWSAAIVARDGIACTSANCVPSTTLNGNATTTYVNSLLHQQGPYDCPEMYQGLRIDDLNEGWNYWVPDGLSPALYVHVNDGPHFVTGGRHTILNIADVLGDVPESDELDNVAFHQYVWSPLEVLKEVPAQRDKPPIRGDLDLPNCDGLEVNRAAGAAWVVGVAPLHPADDYDLFLFDDYVGSTSGFSNFYGASVMGGNATDFMVGHWENTPTTLYPGIVRFEANAGTVCVADQSDAALRQGSYSGAYSNQVMTFGRIVDVYELALTGSQTYYVALHRLSGDSDIAFELFPGASGWVYARGGSPDGVSMPMNANLDTLTYTTTGGGYHPLVVYREAGSGATEIEVRYTLEWGPNPVVDVPEEVTPAYDLSFLGISPNPMVQSGRVNFTLAERGPVRLSVFDLRGRRVGTLLDETREPGSHSINWDGRGRDGRRLGAGIYWLRLEAGGQVITKRVVLLN